ncbi:hypothetical protein [Sulfitobacter sp.]|jgi:hypothetical protein
MDTLRNGRSPVLGIIQTVGIVIMLMYVSKAYLIGMTRKKETGAKPMMLR